MTQQDWLVVSLGELFLPVKNVDRLWRRAETIRRVSAFRFDRRHELFV